MFALCACKECAKLCTIHWPEKKASGSFVISFHVRNKNLELEDGFLNIYQYLALVTFSTYVPRFIFTFFYTTFNLQVTMFNISLT